MNIPKEMTILSSNLPLKDIELALEFIHKRDFESLKDLVSSAIKKITINLQSDNPDPEYMLLSIDELNKLDNLIDKYLEYLGVESLQDPEEYDEELFYDDNV